MRFAGILAEVVVVSMLTVRNLDADVIERLKVQAAAHGRSMEAEARVILTAAVAPRSASGSGLGSRIAALFADDAVSPAVRAGEPARATEFEA